MFYVLSFILGASIGSFVNVIATRLHVAKVISSRSKCLSCGEALRAFDLIPVISYLFLRGKCRYCKSSYGIENIYVEVVYGILYVLLYHFVIMGQMINIPTILWFIYYSAFFITLGVIALYDMRHTYIPLYYLALYCVVTLIMLYIRYIYDPTLVTLLSPVIVALPFLMLWIVSRGRWLGFGDVVLFAGVGAFLGVAQGLAVLLVSVWLGAIVGVMFYIYRRKDISQSTAIPFVPFIVISFLIVLFTDIDIFSIASLFS